MLTIHIILLGKLKESYWREAESEYLKRLSTSVKIVIHELKEITFTDKDPRDSVKQKEAEKIREELGKIKNPFIIALDETGKQFSSLQLSQKLEQWTQTHSEFVFILGGPLGLDDSVRRLAHHVFSLSLLTFTHQMARIILLEQIYRSTMIQEGRKYHY